MSGDPWIKTPYPGVRYRIHPTRRLSSGSVDKDRYFIITYKLDGKTKTEAIGWASEKIDGQKITASYCYDLLSELKNNRKSGHGPRTLKERRAANKRKEAQAKIDRDREAKAMITLEEYWPTYQENAKGNPRKSAATLNKEESHWEKWINPRLGALPIRDIDLQCARNFVTALKLANLADRTVQYIYGTLRQIMGDAFNNNLIPHAPAPSKSVNATLAPDSNRRTRVISPEELNNILDELQKLDINAWRFIKFIAYTGCRVSDAYRLRWENVDLVKNVLTFVKTKNRKPCTIPIISGVAEILEEIGPQKRDEYVFKNSREMPYSESPRQYATVVEMLGLNEGREKYDKVVTHTLRHTMATNLGSSGTPIAVIKEVMNWKTPAMALRYQHPDLDVKEDAFKKVQKVIERKKNNNVIMFSKCNIANDD